MIYFTAVSKTARAQRLRRSFWKKAEAYDGIKSGGMFVAFSDDNPYVPFIDRAYRVFIAIRGGYRYVG